MESLYRKYRPLTFESVVGQQHIVSTLEHAVAEGRLSHAYLFCGPRGTGKTTMARILAKSLLCERADAARAAGASGCMPDGTCAECEAIAAGTHPDVYELDAASRTGVDNVREEIINSVNFAPVRGAYKVYIIDEVHMLTTAAFNALLKTLEEPPSHVVFVLCTTDPQKLLETILSRCQRFDFHRISNEDMVGRMRFICEQEGFAFDEDALDIVAKHARGGMRDALSTLEQLSVFGGGAVKVSDARALLGEVSSAVLSEFACKIAVRDTVGLFGLVRIQVDEGNDLLELARDLVGHMRDVYTAAIAGPRVELFDGTPNEVQAFVEEASMYENADRLARTLTVLDDAVLEMRDASDPRLVLEIALTRLARPESDLTLEALAERIAHLETQLAAGIKRGPMTGEERAVIAPARSAVSAQVAPSVHHAASTPVASVHYAAVPAPTSSAAQQTASSAPVVPPQQVVAPASGRQVPKQAVPSRPSASVDTAAPMPFAPKPVASPQASPVVPAQVDTSASSAQATPQANAQASTVVSANAQPDMAACAPTPAVEDAGDLQRRWQEVVKLVTAAQASRGALLQSSRAASDNGDVLTIAFPAGSNFALKMLGRADSNQLIMPIVCQVFGKRSVEYVMQGASSAPQKPAPATSATPVAAATPARATVPVPMATPALAQSPAPVVVPAPAVAPAPASAASAMTSKATAAPARSAVVVPAPAPAPVQPSAPVAEPVSVEPQDEQAPWEDDQVPYDDASVAAFVDEEEVPPFDSPAPAPTVESKAEPLPAVAPTSVPAADEAPVTMEDAQAVLQSVWGNVTFKPVD